MSTLFRKSMLWMAAAILFCSLGSVVTSCSEEDIPVIPDEPEIPVNAEYLKAIEALDWGTGTCLVYGHKTPDVDAVTSALAYAKLMRALGYDCEARVSSPVNRETEFIARHFEFDLPELQTQVEPQTRLILTDHSEYAQCVNGAREAIILQKIDHHSEGDIKDADVPYVRREMVGSSCTLVYQCYKDAGVVIDDETARILLSGIISDTQNLSKPATCAIDKTACQELARQLGIGPDSLSAINRMMTGTKYDFEGMTDTEIFRSDMKEYSINGWSIAMGSLDYRQPGMDEFLDRMLAAMPEVMEENGNDLIFAKVDEHIPNTGEDKDLNPYIDGGTYFIYYGVGAKAVAESVFGPSLREGVCYSAQKLSRKQIVPLITETMLCMQPDYLVPGDKVALISPSYFTPMENVEKTAEVLRGWGLVPVIGPNVGKVVDGRYAGTVAERVSDIRWALNDPDIKAIICNRGGYGTIQLIDQLTLAELKASPKWIVGFSDITTLHGLWTNAKVMSIHGTMSSFLAKGGTDETSTLMRDLLMGQVPRYELPAHSQNIEGKASGVLVGGNLCTFAPNLGTQADATKGRNLILFIEEVEESMHNIDRQMRILQMNGVLDRCSGIILGEFTDCGSEFTYESVEAMLHEMLKEYNIPVLCGFPAGHGDVNLPMVMGAPVTIDVRPDGATLQFYMDGEQREVRTAPSMGSCALQGDDDFIAQMKKDQAEYAKKTGTVSIATRR